MLEKSLINNKSLILTVIITVFLWVNLAYAVDYNRYSKARIQILNKITGKAKVFDVSVNTIFNFDTRLSLIVKVCNKATQRYTPEDIMFLQVVKANDYSNAQTALLNNTKVLNNANNYIDSLKQQNSAASNNSLEKNSANVNSSKIADSKLIFSGWIFSNHPEISTLTDPTYDISIVKCLN